MKVFIISDIHSDVESIIPYGLRLAKFLEIEVDIIHTIDPRSIKGGYSSYADSQSITPGNKLSADKIIEREKKIADTDLKKILSAEASRLNYPLKINTVIEETEIEAKLKSLSEKDHESIILINTQTSNIIFENLDEIIDTVKKINSIYLILRPGQVFHEFERVILPTNFTAEDLQKYPKVAYLFKDFEPNILAVDIAKNKDYLGTEMKANQWKKAADAVFSESTINTIMLTGKHYNETLITYILKDNPDLVLLFKREKKVLEKLFTKDLMKELLERTDIPVLFYSSD